MMAVLERPRLCLSEIVRAWADIDPRRRPLSLHARLKRLDRFLSNDRLDEAAISSRWLTLSLRLGADVPQPEGEKCLLPVMLDTTYFEPFAALLVSVPCGSRALPIAFTTYHRRTLEACFPSRSHWPSFGTAICPPAPGQARSHLPASSVVSEWDSQNQIEEHLLDFLWSFTPPSLHLVITADRGFARASLFERLLAAQRDFVIRFDADTWITLPDGLAGAVKDILSLQPGETRWIPQARYAKSDQVPVAVLAVWEKGQKEPWYLATTLTDPDNVQTVYRWRMRIECANRDEKRGVILRESGDQHRLTSVLHLHRLLLAICCLHWLAALAGLQSYRDLDHAEQAPLSLAPQLWEDSPPNQTDSFLWLDQGPAPPPPIVPHRGSIPPTPVWARQFVARGPLSYVRLGLEILRSSTFTPIIHRMVRWLGRFLWRHTPLWRPYQIRYRLKHWWPTHD